jgi:synaptosomal-associated protein 29
MAYNSQTGRNPFEDDDDYDSKPSRPYTVTEKSGEGGWSEDPPAPPLSKYQLMEQEKQKSMDRQLEATRRCMSSIYDSEAVGIATAEELVRQGEQLDNVEMKTEKINADTRVSQRHLNGIKSIFGGLKNWWQGEPKNDNAPVSAPPSRNSALRQTIDSSQGRLQSSDGSVHPSLRLRSDNAAGFYDDDIQTFGSHATTGSYSSSDRSTMQSPVSQTSARSAQWNEYEASLDKNLDVMSSGLSQLTMLARGLEDEIETQNDQIDRIMPKVDRADTKIRDQNRQMRQILGKEK